MNFEFIHADLKTKQTELARPSQSHTVIFQMKSTCPFNFRFVCGLKSVLVCTASFLGLFIADLPAAEIPLNLLGNQFYSKTLVVDWKLPTNQIPTATRTFEVIPAKFSHAIVSNLMIWGGFTESNRIWTTDDGNKISSDTFVFRKNDNRQWLTVNPALGLAHLYNPILSSAMPEDVPDKPRAYTLAINILRQLNIPTNELILEGGKPRAWFYEGEMTRRNITRRNHMGVEFRRQLNGIPCVLERIHIDFESHEQITQFEINWRGLKPSKPYQVASTKQMTAWIKEGRARVQSLEGPMEARWIGAAGIKRLTIVGIEPRYTAATSFSNGEEVQAERLYPYAVLQADAELAPDDHETIWLFCPMIAEDLNKPSQAATSDFGFSVYPSTLREKQRRQMDAQ